MKIVLIGAGSHVFARRLITDFLSYPELQNSSITLMDIDKERLDLVTAFARKAVQQWNLGTKVESTTDLRQALEDADYVVTSIRVGGVAANKLDIEIPRKYGVKQGVGDTIGPGGVFYGLRHIPAMLEICHAMEEMCPDAWLINYTNPMAMIMWAVNDHSRIKSIGLCHSVQNTSSELARYIGAPLDEITYWVAGINHMAWFLEFKWKDRDAYPILREKFKDPGVFSRPDAHWAGPDIVRAEIFRALGYFNTESSQHMSEYVPYFRKKPELFDKFKLAVAFDQTSDREERRRRQDEELKRILDGQETVHLQRSDEYCSYIIHSIETGVTRRINGNVRNDRLITNLAEGCCVEVPCLVDRTGIRPCYVGSLPPQCAALNRTNISVQELGVKAAIERDKQAAFHAILVDPLTSSILSVEQTEKMVGELFEKEAKYLKGFA